jgi:hypothetical protein
LGEHVDRHRFVARFKLPIAAKTVKVLQSSPLGNLLTCKNNVARVAPDASTQGDSTSLWREKHQDRGETGVPLVRAGEDVGLSLARVASRTHHPYDLNQAVL